jgi:hypothetical protein
MSDSSATTEREVDSNLFITVSGPPGCGATTLTEGLAAALDCGYVIGGDIFRELAEERDLSLQQLIAKAEEDDGTGHSTSDCAGSRNSGERRTSRSSSSRDSPGGSPGTARTSASGSTRPRRSASSGWIRRRSVLRCASAK